MGWFPCSGCLPRKRRKHTCKWWRKKAHVKPEPQAIHPPDKLEVVAAAPAPPDPIQDQVSSPLALPLASPSVRHVSYFAIFITSYSSISWLILILRKCHVDVAIKTSKAGCYHVKFRCLHIWNGRGGGGGWWLDGQDLSEWHPRVVEGIIGWLIGKLSLHGYIP